MIVAIEIVTHENVIADNTVRIKRPSAESDKRDKE